MDNFRRKGEYSNFNNNNNNRNYANRPNGDNDRYKPNGADSYKRKYNIVSNNKNVPKRVPGGNNIKKQVSSMYGNICNTMQKKFNMTLYKNQGEDSNDVNMNKNRFNIIDNKSSLDRNNQQRVRYNRNFNSNMQTNDNRDIKKSTIFMVIFEEDNNIAMDEGQQEIPKAVFVFITIALVVAAALMWRFMKENDKNTIRENNSSNVASQADIDEDSSELNMPDDFDEDTILSGDDEDQEEELSVDDSSGTLNKVSASENNKDKVQTVKKPTNKPTTGSDSKVESTKKPSSTKKPVSSNTQNNNSTQGDTDEEEEEIIEDVEMAKIAIDVTGDLYRCSALYGTYGTDRFIKYTNFTNDAFGVQVAKKDLSGIWLDVKNGRVVDYVGYSNSVKIPVYKITIRSNFNTRVIYAKKGASVPLIGGRFKEENGTGYVTSPLTASKDIVLIES